MKAAPSLIAVCAWMTIQLDVRAQELHGSRKYTIQDGMPSNTVKNVVKDGLGFLWINHEVGISRFDGYVFKTYYHERGDSTRDFGASLLGLLVVDQKGDVWLNNYTGPHFDHFIAKYDRGSDGFEFHKPKIEDDIWALEVDRNLPVVFLGSRLGGGLYEYNLNTRVTIRHYGNHADSTSQARMNTIGNIVDLGDRLVLFTGLGLWVYVKSTGVFMRPEFQDQSKAQALLDIFPGGNSPKWTRNGFWVHSWNGTSYKLDSTLRVVKEMVRPLEARKGIQAFMDKEDRLWVRNQQGVFRVDSLGRWVKVLDKIEIPWARYMSTDQEGNVWVATNNGLVQILNHHKPPLLWDLCGAADFEVRHIEFLHDTSRYQAIIVGQDSLWDYSVALLEKKSKSAGVRRLLNKDKSKTMGNVVHFSRGKRYLWTATWDAGVFGVPYDRIADQPDYASLLHLRHYSSNIYSIPTDQAWSALEDNQGILWVGTFNGLARVRLDIAYGQEGSVIRYQHDDTDSLSLGHNTVRKILQAGKDSLWVSHEAGVDLFVNGTFFHLFKGYGRVSTILKTSRGTLLVFTDQAAYESDRQFRSFKRLFFGQFKYEWIEELPDRRILIPDERGLLIFDPATGTTTLKSEYNVFNGEPNRVSLLPNGQIALYYGMSSKVAVIDLAALQLEKSTSAPCLVSAMVNNKIPVAGKRPGDGDYRLPADISVLNKLELDYEHNNFTLEFSALELRDPHRNVYRYKLEGYDKVWISTDALNRRATYTNLPTGEYAFRLLASNHDGVWSDNERTLKVVILPPPWRTWWAYTGYSLLAAALLVAARRNIVQRERLKSNLKLAKIEQEKQHFELEKAKEVDRVKTSFFTNISHEFRTPLTLIKGPVDTMLERYKDDPEAVNRLKLVQRNSDLLLKLINQLLDLAKLESGTLKVEKTDGEVYSFIKGVAGSFESMAKQKGINLVIDVPSGQQAARFDKDKVETVLINLINNAIKFTRTDGEVKVRLTVEDGASTAKPQRREVTLRLTVSDTGIGIPHEHQGKIFERFHQVSESHKEVGTGIGLALVKELVTLIEGTIELQSEPGKGSTFTVTIPLEAVSSSRFQVQGLQDEGTVQSLEPSNERQVPSTEYREPSAQHPVPSANGSEDSSDSRPQVLVVEDNADLRAFIIDSLGAEFKFHEAENGKQGLTLATEHIPDMIISDVMMPEMDGMEMTAKLKGDIKTSHIPLILLTAKSGEDSKLEGLSKGADDYLTKPFNKQELLLKVRNGTARMQKIREKMKTEVLSSQPAEKILSQDEQFLNKVKETIIERMSDEQLSVESLADDIGMSRVQLYRKVSALTGMAVNELIRKLRLQRAAQLLSQNWGPVSQVAYEVGFSNLSYFSKVFKEEFDVLPSEYETKD
jgi:signal transduction histidine kinase/DNA-binding response OmpR family regulator/ligand-binding sensor domain-containing protein